MKIYFMTGRTGIDYGSTTSEAVAIDFLDAKPGRKVEVGEIVTKPMEYTPTPKPKKQSFLEVPPEEGDEPDLGEGKDE